MILTLGLCLASLAARLAPAAEPEPDAREILRTVRQAQTSQHIALIGQLRNGARTVPFRLLIEGGVIRYQFTNPAETLQLRLMEKDARLDDITKAGSQKITAARFDDKVRGTDISYEDLGMKFLYWPKASVRGEETKLLQKCWVIQAEPPSKGDSQYSAVTLWIEKKSGGLLQAEAFDAAGTLAKRFKVLTVQKIEGAWMLKQMRIEASGPGAAKDRIPTYLEISGAEK